MQIVVVSDVHGDDVALWRVLQAEGARHVFCLGDGVREYAAAAAREPERELHIVTGNCDWMSGYPTIGIDTVGGKRIVFLHGHTKDVKRTVEPALALAREHKADLLLYGHTHCPLVKKDGNITVCNPGSLGYDGTYLVLSWESAADEILIEKKEI